ncbi:hypothetical protein F5Y13DRAFT_150741 [Hypoxylon sp. FL1857]|nr:hypothetical protein F5Y13DRAFT_150741 [Hypoxylon sp. FL1857]
MGSMLCQGLASYFRTALALEETSESNRDTPVSCPSHKRQVARQADSAYSPRQAGLVVCKLLGLERLWHFRSFDLAVIVLPEMSQQNFYISQPA